MTPEQVSTIAKLAMTNWRTEITEADMEAFRLGLGDVPYGEAMAGVTACLQNRFRRYAVTPSEVLDAVLDARAATTRVRRNQALIDDQALGKRSGETHEYYTVPHEQKLYVRASASGRRTMREWYKRAARDGAEAKAKRQEKKA